MSKRMQQVLLMGPPILVGCLNLTHPLVNPPVYSAIVDHLSWWITLHILNLVLFPALGLAGYLLVRDVHNRASALTKLALILFVPIYTGFDALAGIGTGILVKNAKQMAPDDLATVERFIDAYWNSCWIYAVAAVGSIAWVIAMLSAAVAFTDADRRSAVALVAVLIFALGGWAQTHLFLTSRGLTIPVSWWLITIGMGLAMFVIGKPRSTAALLALSASLFGASHVTPTGPLGMLCFLGAAAYSQLSNKRFVN